MCSASVLDLRRRVERLIGTNDLVKDGIGPMTDLPALERLCDLAELATLPEPVEPSRIATMMEIGAAIDAASRRHEIWDNATVRGGKESNDKGSAAAMDEEMHRLAALQRRAARLPVRSNVEAVVAAGIIRDHLSELSGACIGDRLAEHDADLIARAAALFDALALHLMASTGVSPAEAGVDCYLSVLWRKALEDIKAPVRAAGADFLARQNAADEARSGGHAA